MSRGARGKPSPHAAASPAAAAAGHQRIDRFLWYTRLCHDRDAAQALAERGVVRLNGRRVERAHMPVRAGDLLTLPRGPRVEVLRVLALPTRRGPAVEARTLYEPVAPAAAAAGEPETVPIVVDADPARE